MRMLGPGILFSIVVGVLVLFALTGCDPPARPDPEELATRLPATLTPAELNVDELAISKRVYVPVYSQIYWRHAQATELVATMSVRNIDPEQSLVLKRITYYDSGGEVLRTYLDQPSLLGPMATADFVIPYSDRKGGPGANFLVEWGASEEVPDPIIETVMFGQAGSAGISFVSRGKVIDESIRDVGEVAP